jgi:hypothetical protein
VAAAVVARPGATETAPCRACGASIVLTVYGWGHAAVRHGGDKHPAVPATRPALEADPAKLGGHSPELDPRGPSGSPVTVGDFSTGAGALLPRGVSAPAPHPAVLARAWRGGGQLALALPEG